VYVRFVRAGAHDAPSDADLDRLAEFLIGLKNVATVRVEPAASPTVLRIDVPAKSAEEAAALAVLPLEHVRQALALEPHVESVGVE
jgi:hypothetical protein